MDNLLISKKGKMPVALIVAGIVMLVVGIALFATSDTGWRANEFEKFMAIAAPILVTLLGAVLLATGAGTYGKTHISLYQNHVEGVGLQNGKAQSFYFTKAQGYTLMKQGSQVCVFCNGAGFNIPLSAQDVQAVLHCYNTGCAYTAPNSGAGYGPKDNAGQNGNSGQNGGYGRNQTDGHVIVTCKRCGAQCRVPAGRGTIRIKCPKCGESFLAKS